MIRKTLTKDNIPQLAREATEMLGNGNAVVFPTDTLYGLGVDALNPEAVGRLFALKKRPADKPVPIFVKDLAMAKELAFIDKRQERILEKAWPGPFTFVLDKKEKVGERLAAGTQTVGLRIPDNKFCAALLNEANRPVTASSANVSGMQPSRDIDIIVEQFRKHSVTPDFIVDSGVLEKRNPSMVVDIRGEEPKILRMSEGTLEQLKQILDI